MYHGNQRSTVPRTLLTPPPSLTSITTSSTTALERVTMDKFPTTFSLNFFLSSRFLLDFFFSFFVLFPRQNESIFHGGKSLPNVCEKKNCNFLFFFFFFFVTFSLRTRNSIRGFVHPSVGPSIGP